LCRTPRIAHARAMEPSGGKAVAEGVPMPPAGPSRKRKAPAQQQVNKAQRATTIYNNTTINNYFAAAPGPTVATEDTRPPNLYPQAERVKLGQTKNNGKTVSFIVSQCMRDGELKGGCIHCNNNFISIKKFTPPKCLNNNRNHPEFVNAVEAHDVAYKARNLDAARAARAVINEKRNKLCLRCQNTQSGYSPNEKLCINEYKRMQSEACKLNDGCAYKNCPERGPQACFVLQADHIHPKDHPDPDKRKLFILSDSSECVKHGGVPAMRKEAAKGIQWICGFCHKLERSSKSGRRRGDPKDLPDGKEGKKATQEEKSQAVAKWKATVTYPKQCYVDARKHAIGACEFCKRKVLPGQEQAFPFDHIDPTTKMVGKDTLVGENGGVGGMVGNTKLKMAGKTEAQTRRLLDEEMDKCRLLCENCHFRKEHGYPRRT
jgi:hypothetical protein